MTVAELISKLQCIEPSLDVYIDGHRVKHTEGAIYPSEKGVNFETSKTKREERKCPFRKITTNESIKMDKNGIMSPMKTVEEFGPCYEDNCPYYDTIFSAEGEFRCRRVAIEGSKAKC